MSVKYTGLTWVDKLKPLPTIRAHMSLQNFEEDRGANKVVNTCN